MVVHQCRYGYKLLLQRNAEDHPGTQYTLPQTANNGVDTLRGSEVILDTDTVCARFADKVL